MADLDDIGTFQALSYGEKWRVNRLIAKGESPQDPRMAAAAVELAEKYQRRERKVPLHRGLAVVIIVVGLVVGVLAATQGDAFLVGTMALLVLSNVAQFAFNPMTRPKNVARSLEAAKRVSTAGR